MPTNLRRFIEDCSRPDGVDFFSIILEHGKEQVGRKCPRQYMLPRYTELKRCFVNAFNLIIDYPELTYVEGYADAMIPVEHAWTIDPEGNVIDPTWERFRKDSPKEFDYFGIPIPTDEVRTEFLVNKKPGYFFPGGLPNVEALIKYSCPKKDAQRTEWPAGYRGPD